MIITQTSSAVNNTAFEQKSFGLVESAHLYKVLYSSLYEDKEQVTLGELAANGLDAQRVNGKEDIPISIQLPTELDPHLVVSDCGIGMSLETVQNLYSTYGASTKRNNNNEIGGFGYGSKSPFSLSDSFTVETTNSGITTTASCYLDEGVPKFAVFSSVFTDRPSGTTIRVPVANEETQQKLASKAKYLFVIWDVKPVITGFTQTDEAFYQKSYITAEKGDYRLIQQKVLEARASMNSSYYYASVGELTKFVSVGPFLYNIPVNMLNDLRKSDTFNFFIKNAPDDTVVVPSFNIGDLELSPTREKIEDTQANKKALLTFYENMYKVVTSSLTVSPVEVLEELYDVIETKVHSHGSTDFWVNPIHLQDVLNKVAPTGHNEIVTHWLADNALSDRTEIIKNAVNNPKVVFTAGSPPFTGLHTQGMFTFSYRDNYGVLDVEALLRALPIKALLRTLSNTATYMRTSAGTYRKESYFSHSRNRTNLTLVLVSEENSKKVPNFFKQQNLDPFETVVVFCDKSEQAELLVTVQKLLEDGADLGTFTHYSDDDVIKSWKTKPKTIRQTVGAPARKSSKVVDSTVGSFYGTDGCVSSVKRSQLLTLVEAVKDDYLYILVDGRSSTSLASAGRAVNSVTPASVLLVSRQQSTTKLFQTFLQALDTKKYTMLDNISSYNFYREVVKREEVKTKVRHIAAIRSLWDTIFGFRATLPKSAELLVEAGHIAQKDADVVLRLDSMFIHAVDAYSLATRSRTMLKEETSVGLLCKLAALSSPTLDIPATEVFEAFTSAEKKEFKALLKTIPKRVIDTGETE